MAEKKGRGPRGSAADVKVSRDADGITIRIAGVGRLDIDERLLTECATALVRCADTNKCLAGRLNINENCLNTIVGHNLQAACVSRSFGLARSGSVE